MVDRIDSYFPGRVIDHKQDDCGSTIYASTDNGWTNDDESDAGDLVPHISVSSTHPRSDSPNLIDFDSSDHGDAPLGNNHMAMIPGVLKHIYGQQEVSRPSKDVKSVELEAYPQAQGSLNPESVEFIPSESSSLAHESTPPSSRSFSSYTDARQSPIAHYDKVASFKARIQHLETGHETLKRENDNLDTINEALKQKLENCEAETERLKAKVAEAELLRGRAQKYALKISEKTQADQEAFFKLQEGLEDSKAQLEEYKTKYAGAVASYEPLQTQFQESQTRLLNAVERNKMYEAFARNFLADHPEHTMAFLTVGLHPRDENQQDGISGNTETEALISFDETTSVPVKLSNGIAFSSNESYFCPASMFPTPNYLEEEAQISQLHMHEADQAQTPQSSLERGIDGLKWNDDWNIWDSALQMEQMIRQNRDYHVSYTPGMFIYGIRFVRERNGQKLTPNDGVPDVASRLVIMTGLPDEVHVQRVLEHVRGGRILKAHTVIMATGDPQYNMAYIEFTASKDALAFYLFTRCREFGFFVDYGGSMRVRTSLPATDSYPPNEMIQRWIDNGFTRCLCVADFSVVHLQTVFKQVGIVHSFRDVITHFRLFDDGRFEVSFSSLHTAVRVRDCILESSFYTGSPDGRGVTFSPDPCDTPLEDLQIPFIPTFPTSDLTILSPDNSRHFMTDEEREADGDRLLVEIIAEADPSDPDSFQEHHNRKNIVWEKRANWDELSVYMAYDHDQRRNVPHRRDPKSGTVQTKYHGSWVFSPEEARKEWLYYNINNPEPWAQKTADLIYDATGQIDQRKVNAYLQSKAATQWDGGMSTDEIPQQIIVDDGGLYGDADQSMDQQLDKSFDEAAANTAKYPAAPLLSNLAADCITFDDASAHVPVGVYSNHIGSNSGMAAPLARGQNMNMQVNVSTTPSTTRSGATTPGDDNTTSSGAYPVVSKDMKGMNHGISKPGPNSLATKVTKDNSKAAGKKPCIAQVFW
ncbi:hypothetical protein EsH8_VI_000196 [Colletotrichum jinshuiense]